MKIYVWLFIFLLGLTSSAAAGLKTQVIEYKEGDVVLEGYLAYDDSFEGKRPGILVIHEWMGLNDYAKMRADKLAGLGYVAFAADIYGKGVRPKTVEEANREATKYKNDRALLRQRVHVALEVLKDQTIVDSKRTAAIGYCFGGTTVLELARSGADVKGVVSFHGGLSTPTPQDARNILARVLVLHGAADPFVPAKELEDFKNEMKQGKVKYKIVQYPGAVHGFTNPANKGEIPGALYDALADQKSWKAMQKFFDEIF